MDLRLNEEQQALVDMIRRFTKEEIGSCCHETEGPLCGQPRGLEIPSAPHLK